MKQLFNNLEKTRQVFAAGKGGLLLIVTDVGRNVEVNGEVVIDIDYYRYLIGSYGVGAPDEFHSLVVSAPRGSHKMVASLGAVLLPEILEFYPEEYWRYISIVLNCAPRPATPTGRSDGGQIFSATTKQGIQLVGFEKTLWPFAGIIKEVSAVRDSIHEHSIFRSQKTMIRVAESHIHGTEFPNLSFSPCSLHKLSFVPPEGQWIIGYDNWGNIYTTLRKSEHPQLRVGKEIIITARVKNETREIKAKIVNGFSNGEPNKPIVFAEKSLHWIDEPVYYVSCPCPEGMDDYVSAQSLLGYAPPGVGFTFVVN